MTMVPCKKKRREEKRREEKRREEKRREEKRREEKKKKREQNVPLPPPPLRLLNAGARPESRPSPSVEFRCSSSFRSFDEVLYNMKVIRK